MESEDAARVMAKRRGSRPIFTGERRRSRRWPAAAFAIGIALVVALLLYVLLVDGASLNELL